MCITITVGERERNIMGLATTFLNVVLVFMSLALFCLAIAIRYRLDEKLEFLNGYNSGALPYYLIVVACIMFFCHLVAINFCYNAAYVETRSTNHHLFVTMILVVIALFLLVVISEIVIAVHSSKIRDSLHDGIYKSMKSYKTNMANKVKIDKLHIEYHCCGAETYKEWFKIPWVNVMYVNVDSDEVKPYLKDGEFIKDDVPFSCCNKYSKRACVHHSVKSTIAHRNYEGHTLYSDGCVGVMMTYFSNGLLTPTAILLVWVLIFQAIDVAVMRLLQTSIFEADEMNDPEGPSMAYCLKGVGGGEDNRRYLKRSKERKSKKDSEDDDGSDDDASETDDTDVSSDDHDDDDDGGGSEGMEAASSDGGGGAVLGESQFTKADTGKDEGSGRAHDDDDGGKGKKSKEEKKREKQEKKEAKKKKKEDKEKGKGDKKLGKKKSKEEKKAKKKEKKDSKKDKKPDKKQKSKDKKSKKKASKDNKNKDKKNKKKAEKDKKKKAKKDVKAKKKADKKRKQQAKKEAKGKKKQAKKQKKPKKKKK